MAGGRPTAAPHVPATRPSHKRGLDYDYAHTAMSTPRSTDHSRLAYAEIHDDEKGPTCAAFLSRAAAFYASVGIRVQRVLTDNAKNYRRSHAFLTTADQLGITLKAIRPHCPWTNGKACEDSTAPSPPNGPTPSPSPPTTNAPGSCPPGSTTTT